MAPFPNFIGPTYQSASPLVDAEECINWYPENAGSLKFTLVTEQIK